MTERVDGLRAHAANSTSPPRALRDEASPSAPSVPTNVSASHDDIEDHVVSRRPLFASPGETYVNTSDEGEDDWVDSDGSFHGSPDGALDFSVPELLKDHTPDFSGELQRKVSRMRAISDRTLTTWRKEWCVISHNFLVLFASRSDWTVRKCILLSAIQSAQMLEPQERSRTFKIMLDSRSSGKPSEKIVLRASTPAKNPSEAGTRGVIASAQRWVDEINQRITMIAEPAGRLVPCLPLVGACQLVQQFQEELELAQEQMLIEARQKLRLAKMQVFAQTLLQITAAKLELQLHGVFEDLVLNARLQKCRGLRRIAAVRRLVSALAKPRFRYLHSMFLHWADFGTNQMKIAAAIFAAEKQRAREKSIRLGTLILTGLIRDWEAAEKDENCRWVFLQLARQAQSTKDSSSCERYWDEKSSPIVSVSQRFHAAVRALHVVLRHLRASQCESALRTWSIMAARCQQAEARELIRATSDLNQQLMNRCKEVPVESSLKGMVLAIRAAQLRRVLFAFMCWSSIPCSPVAKSPMEEQTMSESKRKGQPEALRYALDGSPPPSPLGTDMLGNPEGRLNFSPPSRHEDA